MTPTLRLHVPVPHAAPDPAPADAAGTPATVTPTVNTPTTLQGKVVGFIDNNKPNFNLLAADIGALLIARYGVRAVLVRQKPSASVPAAAAIIDELARKCDLVIAGSGD